MQQRQQRRRNYSSGGKGMAGSPLIGCATTVGGNSAIQHTVVVKLYPLYDIVSPV